MFLEQLTEYGRRVSEEAGDEALPPMYQWVPVRYILKLDRDGRYLGLVDTSDPGRPQDRRGTRRIVPDRKRSSGISAKLLADNGEYVLGLAREGSKPDRVARQHEAFVELVRRCAEQTGEADVGTVFRFLQALDATSLGLPGDFDPSANITFAVRDRFPADLPAVQAFWAREASSVGADAGDSDLQCLVCGQMASCPEMLPVSIKGIPGGQSSGMQLVSANSDVFESYGLSRGKTSPICEECGLLACNALNSLLGANDSHLIAGDMAYIFWTRAPVTLGWGSLFAEATADEVRDFLSGPWTGKAAAIEIETAPFFAAALSAAAARVVVRDWIVSTLGEAQRHLQRYFRLQRLVSGNGDDLYFPLWRLQKATTNAHSKREQAATQVGQALMHVALRGGPLPQWLLYQVVRRTRAEQGVTAAQAALIKMVLLSWQRNGVDDVSEHDDMARLSTNHPEVAYHCGRLLAELEAIQEAALGKATVVDRYFGTASSAPASVFGRLLRGAQPHLSKLQRDQERLWRILDERLRTIASKIDTLPRTLTLQQQGLFALGYWHQKEADIRERIASKAAREAKVVAGPTLSAGDE